MILVFGKTGQVAREIARHAGPREMVFVDRSEADLTNPGAVQAAIALRQPQAVINAAAYTAVDRAEEDPDAMVINGRSVGAMASMCATLDIPLVHISTDYVFDGAGQDPHGPKDMTNPVNAYGASKLAGEKAVCDMASRYAILRTSWVVSAHGSNFVKTMLRLAQSHDSINVVDDQIGGPTPAADIARACLHLADKLMAGKIDNQIVHFAGTPAVSWADFAREIFQQSGQDTQITGIPTTDYPTPARRPLNSRLECAGLEALGLSQPDWRAGLKSILHELETSP